MVKPTAVFILLFAFHISYSQQDVLVFKKNRKDVQRYWMGTTIAFQLKNKEWRKGEITRIQHDSFYIRPMVVRYSIMGTDTIHYPVTGFAITDVYAMPNKGILIDYSDGRFQISGSGGHVHWYWVKSGWIFRVGAAGYTGLHIINDLREKNFSFSGSRPQLFSAAAVFLGGVLLKKTYKPYLRIGRKYHIYTFKF